MVARRWSNSWSWYSTYPKLFGYLRYKRRYGTHTISNTVWNNRTCLLADRLNSPLHRQKWIHCFLRLWRRYRCSWWRCLLSLVWWRWSFDFGIERCLRGEGISSVLNCSSIQSGHWRLHSHLTNRRLYWHKCQWWIWWGRSHPGLRFKDWWIIWRWLLQRILHGREVPRLCMPFPYPSRASQIGLHRNLPTKLQKDWHHPAKLVSSFSFPCSWRTISWDRWSRCSYQRWACWVWTFCKLIGSWPSWGCYLWLLCCFNRWILQCSRERHTRHCLLRWKCFPCVRLIYFDDKVS